jgi:hypothetical protein
LYGSEDLANWQDLATLKTIDPATYDSGKPTVQARDPDPTVLTPVVPVELSVIVTPGVSGAGAKRFYKVVSGATQDPIAETSP